MSIHADLLKAESLVADLESYVAECTWQPGRHHKALIEITEVDTILKALQNARPSLFVQTYVRRTEKLSELRRRWLALKDTLPTNPWM